MSLIVALSLWTGVIAPGCDDGGGKDTKAASKAEGPKSGDAKTADDAKADAKTDDAKAGDAQGDDAQAESDDANGDDANAESGDEPSGDDANADDAKEDVKEDPPKEEPKKAEPKKAEPKKAEPKKADPKKADPKKDEPKADPAAAAIDGGALYKKKCKNCHGIKGDADTKIGKKHDIASWKEAGWKSKWPMSKVEDIVTNGKAGTKMKAFKGKLTPEEIDAVSKYARRLGS